MTWPSGDQPNFRGHLHGTEPVGGQANEGGDDPRSRTSWCPTKVYLVKNPTQLASDDIAKLVGIKGENRDAAGVRVGAPGRASAITRRAQSVSRADGQGMLCCILQFPKPRVYRTLAVSF